MSYVKSNPHIFYWGEDNTGADDQSDEDEAPLCTILATSLRLTKSRIYLRPTQ